MDERGRYFHQFIPNKWNDNDDDDDDDDGTHALMGAQIIAHRSSLPHNERNAH
jgi:hypothetical protein